MTPLTKDPESIACSLIYLPFTAAVSVVFRWRQLQTFYGRECSGHVTRANNLSLVLGLLASFGVLLVANFQVRIKNDYRRILKK